MEYHYPLRKIFYNTIHGTIHGFQTFEIKIHEDIILSFTWSKLEIFSPFSNSFTSLVADKRSLGGFRLAVKEGSSDTGVDFETCSPNIVGIGFNSRNRFIRDKPERKYLFSK